MKRKMKIDIIVKYYYPVAAGIETNIMETYSSLVDKADITIHTSVDSLTQKNVYPKNDSHRGIAINRYPYKLLGYWPSIDWNKSDIVCLHNSNVFPHTQILLYVWLRRKFGLKTPKMFLTPHGGFNPEWSIFPLSVRILKRLYHESFGVWMLNHTVDRIRAVSQWEMDEMVKTGVKKEKVEVISNGVEDEAFTNLEKTASSEIKKTVKMLGTYVIQIGRIYSIKNYETTIRALALTPSSVNYAIVGPVGNEQYLEKIKALIDQLGLQNRVFFLGVVRGVDKFYLIRHATAMVHMAIWESFCNVVHEALSQGVPCIVANNTALPLLITDKVNGYCIETRDYKEVARRILYIVKKYDTQTIKKMRKVNKERGSHMRWSNTANRMYELYSQIITKENHE